MKENAPGAVASLVCGIVSVVLCWVPVAGLVLGIVALVLSRKAKKNVISNPEALGGGGLATGGLVCGIVGTVLSVIYSLMFAVGIWKLASVTDKGRETRVKGDIQVIMMALRKYEGDAGSFPNTDQGLQALVQDPGNVRNWSPSLDEPLYDPWNNEYGYRFPGKFSEPGKPDIFSRGPDGIEGTEDDIGNWGRR